MKLLITMFFLLPVILENTGETGSSFREDADERMLVMFWNLENLFHPAKDTTYLDEEYLPEAPKRWTWTRYRRKLHRVSSCILSVCDCTGIYPDIVGVAEIENDSVMRDLVAGTSLSRLGYAFVHFESPDRRGIDVALLYRRARFRVLESRPVPVLLPEGKPTRDILYVKGVFRFSGDTVHLYVNHWPSKYGGRTLSLVNRRIASQTLQKELDSVRKSDRHSVIVMGDFNDERDSGPVKDLERVLAFPEREVTSGIGAEAEGVGTNKFRNVWSTIDMILYAGDLAPSDGVCHTYAPAFLLLKDRKYSGYRMNRTFQGPSYAGGISDHLPVFSSFVFSSMNSSSLKPKASSSRESPIGSM